MVFFSWSSMWGPDRHASPFGRGTGRCDTTQPGPDEHGSRAIPRIPETSVLAAAKPLPSRDFWQLVGAIRQVRGEEGFAEEKAVHIFSSFFSLFIHRLFVILHGCRCDSLKYGCVCSFGQAVALLGWFWSCQFQSCVLEHTVRFCGF